MRSFPENSEDKTIFEAAPGVYYAYNKASNSWNKLPGVGQLGLATYKSNGLMSKDDLRKVEDLVIPPPQSSLSSEKCDFTYKSGTIALYSGDDYLSVTDQLKVGAGTTSEQNVTWGLHKNTHAFNFTINLQELITELDRRGNITKAQIQGNVGLPGPKGDPGIDKLNTGPVGGAGKSGLNHPFAGSVNREAIKFAVSNDTSNRAIVDIAATESEDGNYLIVTRANIGNLDAQPNQVCVTDGLESPWLMVLDIQNEKQATSVETSDCRTGIVCRTSSSVYYINIDSIIEQFQERFDQLLLELKQLKESVASEWLRVMVAMFAEQKAALCCAMENCNSRKRNTTDRRYIETQRTQAAQAGLNVSIDGDSESKPKLDMNEGRVCIAQVGAGTVTQGAGDCEDPCEYIVELDAITNTGNQDNALVFDLPAGEWVASIVDCCANLNTVYGDWTGRVQISYKHRHFDTAGLGPITTKTVQYPNCGKFQNEEDAQNAYDGLNIQFTHSGGEVGFLIPDKYAQDNSGSITICLQKAECYVVGTGAEFAEEFTNDEIFAYKNDIDAGNFLGVILPFNGGKTAIENYGLGTGSDADGANITHGCQPVFNQTSFFYYNGSDGMSFFTINGARDTNENFVEVDYKITNNEDGTSVIVSDDANELQPTSVNQGVEEFGGRWSSINQSDGGVLGHFSRARTAPWIMEVTPTNLGILDTIKICSRDGRHIYLTPPRGTLKKLVSIGGPTYYVKPKLVASFKANEGLKLKMNGGVGFMGIGRGRYASGQYSNRLTFYPDGFSNPNPSPPYSAAVTTIHITGYLRSIIGKLYVPSRFHGLVLRFEFDDGSVEEIMPQTNETVGMTSTQRQQGSNAFVRFEYDAPDFPDSPNQDVKKLAQGDSSGYYYGSPIVEYMKNRFVYMYVRTRKPGKLYMHVNDFSWETTNVSWPLSPNANSKARIDTRNRGQYDVVVDICEADRFDPVADAIPGTAGAVPTNPFCEEDPAVSDLTKIVFTKFRDGCLMPYTQVEWYERGWRTDASCGAWVELDGQKWLVVKRSIGIDHTCGGGESEDTECIRVFLKRLGHPAIAWPSLDGDEFFGRPTSGNTTFLFDKDISGKLMQKIRNGDVLDSKGDLDQLTVVIVPASDDLS